MRTCTYDEFIVAYHNIKATNPSYRLGQHFINCFIKDSTTPNMQKLWNNKSQSDCVTSIMLIMQDYKWDYRSMPLLENAPC